MIELPFADPGRPSTRSPARLLLWVGRRQLGSLAAGVVFGTVWMVSQALMPYVLGQAIDDGLANGDEAALGRWVAALLALGVIQAVAGVLRHRVAVLNWLLASYRLIQVIARHVAQTGPAVRGRLTTGEVVATVSNDALRAGGAFDITARLAGAIVSYVVVAVAPALRRRRARPRRADRRAGARRLAQLRDRAAAAPPARAAGGSRAGSPRSARTPSPGCGCSAASAARTCFLARYRDQSQAVRHAGVRVALPQSTLDAAQVLLPGIFVVLVTWLGARLAVTGSIEPGELVAFYGYAAFLVIPLRTSAEAVDKITRSLVGARRMLAVLDVEPAVADSTRARARAAARCLLADERSGVVVEPGLLTCVVDRRAGRGRRARRPARPVRRRPGRLARRRAARRPQPRRRAPADPRQRDGSDALLRHAAERARPVGRGATTSASSPRSPPPTPRTFSTPLPAGLDERIEERGRGFSGGQRQRLALARTLVADAEVLVLVEPTSAVDAHTEARIARRLQRAREGRTTVVDDGSPLVLDQADRVLFLEDGRVAATGRHRELLDTVPAYRDTVTRGEEDHERAPPHRRLARGARARPLLARRHRRALAAVIGLHGLAAVAGLAGPRLARRSRPGRRGRHDHPPRRPGGRAARGVRRRADGAHLVRTPRVVRALRGGLRPACARTS